MYVDWWGQILGQLLQPTFFYSTVLALAAMLCSTLLVRINHTIGSRGRSVMYVLPLLVPLAITCLFPPQLYLHGGMLSLGPGPESFGPGGGLETNVLSYAGMAMVVGLVLAYASLVLSRFVGNRITRKLMRVVDMGADDFPELQADVSALAVEMGVAMPRIGLVEDLRPNAFTFGSGKHTTVVFSLGILDLLDREELRAVAAHELAHVRNGDVDFKRISQALMWLSFFNPAAHLAIRAARREREKYADETARQFLEEKDTLLRAIEKVNAFIEGTSRKRGLIASVGLSFSLSIAERTSLLSDHPSFTDRTRSYRGERAHAPLPRAACIALSVAVIASLAVAVVSVGDVHSAIMHDILPGALGHMPGFDPSMVHSYHLRSDIALTHVGNVTVMPHPIAMSVE